MLPLDGHGEFNKWDHVKSGIEFTDKVLRCRIVESLEVTSTHALYCAGGSGDTKWSELISDMVSNDYASLRFTIDTADRKWLPVIYLPLGCVINNNIGDAYKVQALNSGKQLNRFIGQYWAIEVQPWIGETRSIPHKPVLTLATPDHAVVLG